MVYTSRRGARWRKAVGLSISAALLLGATTPGPAGANSVTPSYLFVIDWVKCIDQTGLTNAGADQIYAKVIDNHPSGYNTMYTNLILDMDPGDTGLFDHYSRVIAPKRVHREAAPFTSLDGKAEGDAWSENRWGAHAPLSFTVALYEWDAVTADDHIQTRSFSFTAASLAADIPSNTGTKTYTQTFKGDGGEFQVRIAVHRMI